jgi:hypothetical protein
VAALTWQQQWQVRHLVGCIHAAEEPWGPWGARARVWLEERHRVMMLYSWYLMVVLGNLGE